MARRRLGAGVAVVVVFGAVIGAALWRQVTDRALDSLPVASVAGAQLERGAAVDPALDARLRRSVVRVEATGCGVRRQGSATLLDPGSGSGPRMITNQHVVAGSVRAETRDDAGAPVVIDVRRRLVGRDAVVLSADPLLALGDEPLPVGPRPVVGSAVVVAGYPAGGFEAHAGHVVAVERRQGYGGTVDMLIVDVEAIPGISGGVVVDGQGRAVGVVAARDPSTGHTVAYPVDSLSGRSRLPDRSC